MKTLKYLSYSLLLTTFALACAGNDSGDGDNSGTITGDTAFDEPIDGVIFVNQAASGENNGKTWSNAYQDLQAALTAATSGDSDTTQIWLASGIYKPTADTTARGISFSLITEITIYGHFQGTESSLGQRDLTDTAFMTILSGDIDNNDTLDSFGRTETINGNNSFHLFFNDGADTSGGLADVNLTGGQANASSNPDDVGGAIYNSNTSPSVENVTFSGNFAGTGGAIYNSSSSPSLENVTFSGNSVDGSGTSANGKGGGIYNTSGSSPILSNVTFSDNSAVGGGAIANVSSSPSLENVTFTGNSATENGGAISNVNLSTPILENVTFTGNTANGNGGAFFNKISNPSLDDVTFSSNTATEGGAIYNDNSNLPTLDNVTFSDNTATDAGGAVYNLNNSSPRIVNATFSGNRAGGPGQGGAIYNNGGSPRLENVTFNGNSTGGLGSGGAIFNYASDPKLINVTFSDNTSGEGGAMTNDFFSDPSMVNVTFNDNSSGGGGAIKNGNNSDSSLVNVVFSGNSTIAFGGAISNSGGNLSLVNVIFIGNSAGFGGAISNSSTILSVVNVTFSGNTATFGGAMYNASSNPNLVNCLLWNNGDEISNSSSTPTISFSLIEGSGGSGSWVAAFGTDGGDNSDVDPLFVDAGNGDFSLQAGSPAIDDGDNSAVPIDDFDLDDDTNTGEQLPLDLAGNQRVIGGTVDIGAYEVQ